MGGWLASEPPIPLEEFTPRVEPPNLGFGKHLSSANWIRLFWAANLALARVAPRAPRKPRPNFGRLIWSMFFICNN